METFCEFPNMRRLRFLVVQAEFYLYALTGNGIPKKYR
jgi:hypothetical protein